MIRQIRIGHRRTEQVRVNMEGNNKNIGKGKQEKEG
jgi:hypothetical protein